MRFFSPEIIMIFNSMKFSVLLIWLGDCDRNYIVLCVLFTSVLLMMWNSVAELALEHLKPNDFIYASGSLGSYTKPGADGIPGLNYKVIYTVMYS